MASVFVFSFSLLSISLEVPRSYQLFSQFVHSLLHLSATDLLSPFQPFAVYMHSLQLWLHVIALGWISSDSSGKPCLYTEHQHGCL